MHSFTPWPAAFAVCLLGGAAQAAEPAWSGEWDLVAEFDQGRSASTLSLTLEEGKVAGASGPLDEAGFLPLTVRGKPVRNGVEVEFFYKDAPVGTATLTGDGESLSGRGSLYAVPVRLSASRRTAVAAPARTHDVQPRAYTVQYSARTTPILRIRPGDRVRTSTLDNMGRDERLTFRWMPGNTLTGPFWIEGAMPGDTLVVRLERVALNRDTAEMWGGSINAKATGAYEQSPTPGWSRTWLLDRERGVARPGAPSGRVAGLELPLRPMIGSIGVAPPLNQSWFAGDLGFHGGNLDYQRVTEGTTLYLPVWQAGAFLALGDGHALQGDGEITGQGLETSLDVEFTVDLIRGKTLGQVWMEDAEDVMVSGIDNSLDDALRMATTGMARWLKDRYGLTDSEIATLMGAAVRYDIAEVVDARPHVVARLSKKILATIGPAAP